VNSKRLLDLALAPFLLALAAPLLGLAALAVLLDTSGPVLFRQERLGRWGRTFTILKLRTMAAGAEAGGVMTRRDDPRITRVGRLLRATRMDELPQLINVIRGDMSLVGPRPLLPRFLPYYAPSDLRRMEVSPGMTGWQQVRGAARHRWRERVDLDVWYVDHRSLLLDLRILLETVRVVIRADSAYAPDGSQESGLPEGAPREGPPCP
jgi:lipopolysaccharide/colanic/teichoic acid biosynthesis glycosyltransferase